MTYDVYGIGNALVDYLAHVTDDFLVDNRIDKGVMTLVDKPSNYLLDSFSEDVVMCSGGSAANTMVGVAMLGGKGCYSGKVGDDDLGNFYRNDLQKMGVDFFAKPTNLPTGSCVSLISKDGERSMQTFLGASTALQKDDINRQAVKDSKFIYIEGYLWDSPTGREAALFSMELARQAKTRVAFSFSDPFLVNRFGKEFIALANDHIDLLFCNDQEAMRITGRSTPEQAIVDLGKLCNQVCITLGADGAIIKDADTVRKTPALAAKQVVDTTGAGDLYAAGVLRGLTAGFDLVCSSMIGARAASAIVEQVGARLEF